MLRSTTQLNFNAKRWAFGAAALTACLQAGAASALSFNFTFTGTGIPTGPATVTGTVDGLVDNLNDQKTGLTVTVTSATNSLSLPATFTDSDYNFGSGFDVSGGQVTGVDIQYINNGTSGTLQLGNQSGFIPSFRYNIYGLYNFDTSSSSTNSLLFTPVASVPGPLPLLGAGAAFGWSRRLRRRIQAPA